MYSYLTIYYHLRFIIGKINRKTNAIIKLNKQQKYIFRSPYGDTSGFLVVPLQVFGCVVYLQDVCGQNAQLYNFKETVRGGRVASISTHSIQCCDWPTCIHKYTVDIHEHYTFTQMYAHTYIHIKSNYLTQMFDEKI